MEGLDKLEQETPLLVVCGPTASGKTRLSIELAKRMDGEIVSADSMQIYCRMDIGTAKPTVGEIDGIPHHLLDILAPGERFSVAQYVEQAKAAIGDITARGRLAILAGGTGLYIDSLTRNIQFAAFREDLALREELRQLAALQGNAAVWALLRDCDPDLAQGLHPNNMGRIIRGIEVFQVTGKPLSQWQRESTLTPPTYQLCMLGLGFRDREALYKRIDARVDGMLDQGLLDEVRTLMEDGLSATAGQAIGYKELFGYFRGESTLDQAVDAIKRESRRYAKRQLTWLRRDPRIRWLYGEDYDSFSGLLEAGYAMADQRLNGEANDEIH